METYNASGSCGWGPPHPDLWVRDRVCPICHRWSNYLSCRMWGVWLWPPRCERCEQDWLNQFLVGRMNKPSDIGRALQALRRHRRGRKKVLLPCPGCGQKLGAREQREHKCPKKKRHAG